MKFLKGVKLENNKLKSEFDVVEEFIYRKVNSEECLIIVVFERENCDSEQYPLESILDLYGVSLGKEIESEDLLEGQYCFEFIGDLMGVKLIKDLIGRRAYETYENKFFRLVFENMKGQ